MKILIISQYFYPENFRINELCFELAKSGHQIDVITGFPNYPDGYIYAEYADKRIKEEEINNVRIFRVNLTPRRKNPISLILNYLSYAINASKKIKQLDKDYNNIFVFGLSPITQIIPAWIYKKRLKIPMIINCQDIWPDSIKVYGIKERSMIFKLTKKLSSFLYQKGDYIVTSSPGFNKYLQEICSVDNKKITYLPNFAEDYYLDFDNKSKIQDKLHLLFAGNIGKAQNLETIVYAVERLSEKSQIVIDILGDGSNLNNLKLLVKKCGLSDIFMFHGRKDSKEIKPFYEIADAFLITLEGNSPVSLTIPSKLQGYMGAGKPILGAINGGAKDIINIANCGKCVNAGDIDGLAKIILLFINDETHLKQLGQNGRDYFINHFTINRYIQQIIAIMEDIK